MTRIKSAAISEASKRNAAARQRDGRGHFLPVEPSEAAAGGAEREAPPPPAPTPDPSGPPARERGKLWRGLHPTR